MLVRPLKDLRNHLVAHGRKRLCTIDVKQIHLPAYVHCTVSFDEVFSRDALCLEITDVEVGQTVVDISCQRTVSTDCKLVNHFGHKIRSPTNYEALKIQKKDKTLQLFCVFQTEGNFYMKRITVKMEHFYNCKSL